MDNVAIFVEQSPNSIRKYFSFFIFLFTKVNLEFQVRLVIGIMVARCNCNNEICYSSSDPHFVMAVLEMETTVESR